MVKSGSSIKSTPASAAQILEQVPGLVAIYNLQTGVYSYVNQAVWPILGYRPEEFMQGGLRFVGSLMHPDDAEQVLIKNQASLELANNPDTAGILDESIVNFEYRMRHKNGSWRWLQTDGRIFSWTPDQKVESVINISIDITGRKAAEERVEQQRQELELQKDQFAAMVGHELKTPVAGIKAYSQLVQRRLNRSGQKAAAGDFDKINNQLTKLTQLIDDLLDTTKLQAGELKLRRQPFDYDELVAEVVETAKLTQSSRLIEVKGRAGKQLVGDKDRVEQVLLNLLSNAIKYSPPDQPVTVTIQASRSEVTTAVTDRGIGISAQDLKQVFKKFFRISSPSHRAAGLGLGLHISAELISRLGGRIWAESQPGQGSTFYFTLPL